MVRADGGVVQAFLRLGVVGIDEKHIAVNLNGDLVALRLHVFDGGFEKVFDALLADFIRRQLDGFALLADGVRIKRLKGRRLRGGISTDKRLLKLGVGLFLEPARLGVVRVQREGAVELRQRLPVQVALVQVNTAAEIQLRLGHAGTRRGGRCCVRGRGPFGGRRGGGQRRRGRLGGLRLLRDHGGRRVGLRSCRRRVLRRGGRRSHQQGRKTTQQDVPYVARTHYLFILPRFLGASFR